MVPNASRPGAAGSSTFDFARCQLPSASITLHTTANSSGISDIASVSPTSRPCVHESSRSANTRGRGQVGDRQPGDAAPTSRRSSSCRRLARGAELTMARWMPPSAVAPVAGHLARHRRAPPDCLRTAGRDPRRAARLSCGIDSPVRRDSSTCRPTASSEPRSADSRSPSLTRGADVAAHELAAGDVQHAPQAHDHAAGTGQILQRLSIARCAAPGRSTGRPRPARDGQHAGVAQVAGSAYTAAVASSSRNIGCVSAFQAMRSTPCATPTAGRSGRRAATAVPLLHRSGLGTRRSGTMLLGAGVSASARASKRCRRGEGGGRAASARPAPRVVAWRSCETSSW